MQIENMEIEVTHCARKWRVDFYYNDNDDLEYIRVRDLIPDEYYALKSSAGRC